MLYLGYTGAYITFRDLVKTKDHLNEAVLKIINYLYVSRKISQFSFENHPFTTVKIVTTCMLIGELMYSFFLISAARWKFPHLIGFLKR